MGQTGSDMEALEHWVAGEEVAWERVCEFGLENCFSHLPVDSSLLLRIKGKSYRDGCVVPLGSLRYVRVLHYDLEGRVRIGEMICHEQIGDDLVDIFRRLFDAGYPIERMVLIDEYDADDERSMAANNTSAFNYRVIAGTNRILQHGLGMAVDVNPLYNPYVRRRGDRVDVQPLSARAYVDRSKDFPCKIDTTDLCYKEFVRHGFVWGGDWKSLKDYQHFEKPLSAGF